MKRRKPQKYWQENLIGTVEQGHQDERSCGNCKANLHNLRHNYDIFLQPLYICLVRNPVTLCVVNVCCCSVTQSCLTLWDPRNLSTPGFPVFTVTQSLLRLMSIESVMPSLHIVLCHLLLLLSSIFPSIRGLSNESDLCIRWPKFWSLSFKISPSNEYSGLISFRIDWLSMFREINIVELFFFPVLCDLKHWELKCFISLINVSKESSQLFFLSSQHITFNWGWGSFLYTTRPIVSTS